jgi:hypothetical protein
MVGTTEGFPIEIVEALAPTISPLNPTEVPAITYKHLLCLPSKGHFSPPAQQKALGLL